MPTKSALQAFNSGCCPKCRQGKVFKFSLAKIWKFRETNDKCSVCHVKFESEPGFFWGAMYFSYALTVGLFVMIGIYFFSIYEDPPFAPMVTTAILAGVICSPFVFRLSRMLMIYLAAPYRHYDSRFSK